MLIQDKHTYWITHDFSQLFMWQLYTHMICIWGSNAIGVAADTSSNSDIVISCHICYFINCSCLGNVANKSDGKKDIEKVSESRNHDVKLWKSSTYTDGKRKKKMKIKDNKWKREGKYGKGRKHGKGEENEGNVEEKLYRGRK